MAHEKPPAGGSAAPAAKVSLVGRLLRPGQGLWKLATATRRRAITSALLAVGIIGATWAGTLMWEGPALLAYPQRLDQALAQFDDGHWQEARQQAAALLRDAKAKYGDHGGTFYLLGALTLREADEQINPERRKILSAVAARYLEEARARGVPAGRRPACLMALGRALHGAGQYPRSVTILNEVLPIAEGDASVLHALLADSYMRLSPPKLKEALEHHRLFLAAPGLTAERQEQGRLREGQILLTQREYAAAIAAAAQVPPASPHYSDALILHGRALVERMRLPADQRPADLPQQATALVDSLKQLLARGPTPPAIAAQVDLLVGLFLQEQGDLPAASSQFDRTRRQYSTFPEGLAATVYFATGAWSTNPQQAVALYKQALLQAGPGETYSNIWLPLDDFQRRVERAIDDLVAAEQFAAALSLASSLTPLFPRALAVGRQAETHESWARRLEERARMEKVSSAEITLAEARQHYRQAAAAQRELAQLRIATRFYTEDLAHAADNFRLGQGYSQAVSVYRELLAQDAAQGRPEALTGLGESLLALGQIDEALAALNACRDAFPKHPTTYRARLLASLALAEQGELAESKQLLIDNLYKFSLAPQSTDWRDSLFALGEMLYREALDLESRSRLAGVDNNTDGDARRAGLALLEQSHTAFEEALKTLNEAVQRYPSGAQTVQARHRIAEAHRHSAKWPRKRLASVTIVTSKAALTRQMHEQLQLAVNEYNGLITRLSEQPDAARTLTDEAILRNCYFGRADALFDLEQWGAAIEAYSAATNRYQHNPESLEAYVQIASCYRRLDRLSEARGTLEQARVVLQRIRPDADFARTTRLRREDWIQLLDWLRTL